MKPLRFPAGFTWGVATAAPQIEGAAFADGKSASVWDTFSRRPGAVLNGDTPDAGCDHYRKFDEDFALMRRLGVRHYRMSLAWPRILPAGRGAVNRKGVDFYHRLFDSLARHGITPWVTMFHWDLPQALEDEGGWRARGVTDAFAQYADTIVSAYGDRVKNWITLNEIFCFTRLGYGTGQKAPGHREPEQVVNQTYHHALLAHGHGVRAVREHGGRGARVGLTDNAIVTVPVDLSAANITAARRAFVEENIRVLDPVFTGRYSPTYHRITGADAATVRRGDLAHLAQKMDFLGLNIYTGLFVRAGKGGRPEKIEFPPNYPRTDCAWHYLMPQVLYWGPKHVTDLYGPLPLYITENGAGYDEVAPVNGHGIDDLHRRETVRQHLTHLRAAMAERVPVKGYFLWSFMDNYEWEDGYQRRFGIVYNDFATQQRTPKLSARWYTQVMKQNALV
ncbi:MAG TPA: GH1 family beta-glucosidase [Lacunisphaera sp.]|nr:GH1 family beta-glucosidase [Lacunisphaera sp.]